MRVREIIVKATGRAAGQSDHTTGCTVLCTAGRRHLYCPTANEALSISDSRNTPKGSGQEKTTKTLKTRNYFSNHHPSFVINQGTEHVGEGGGAPAQVRDRIFLAYYKAS